MKRFVAITIFSMIFYSCLSEQEPSELSELTPIFYNYLKPRIDTAASLVNLDLTLLMPVEWDSILVLKPYCDIEKLNCKLENTSALKRKFKYHLYQDSHQYLVFIKSNVAKSFAKVQLRTIDFTDLTTIFPVITKAESTRLHIRSDKYSHAVVVYK